MKPVKFINKDYKMIIRDKNILSNKKDLKFLYVYKRFPIYQICTNEDVKEDKFFDMSWFISKSTGVIQLKKLIPLKFYIKTSMLVQLEKLGKNIIFHLLILYCHIYLIIFLKLEVLMVFYQIYLLIKKRNLIGL